MNQIQHDYLYKIILIGDRSSGKTSLMKRFAEDIFQVGVDKSIKIDFNTTTINFNDKIIKLQLWDPMTQERYRLNASFRGAHGIIIVFDITNRESFNNVKKWLMQVGGYACKDVNVLIVGNKLDMCDIQHGSREVSTEEANEYCSNLDIDYIETSTKYNINVDQCFIKISLNIYNRLQPDIINHNNNNNNKNNSNNITTNNNNNNSATTYNSNNSTTTYNSNNITTNNNNNSTTTNNNNSTTTYNSNNINNNSNKSKCILN